jgi:hypothetical protein
MKINFDAEIWILFNNSVAQLLASKARLLVRSFDFLVGQMSFQSSMFYFFVF